MKWKSCWKIFTVGRLNQRSECLWLLLLAAHISCQVTSVIPGVSVVYEEIGVGGGNKMKLTSSWDDKDGAV